MPLKFAPGSDTNLTKAVIQAIEGSMKGKQLSAYFNPTQLVADKQVNWKQHAATEGDAPTLEFTAGTAMSFTAELMFDMFEQQGNVHATYIADLRTLALIDDSLKRPPLVTFTWGTNMPTFQGVIKSMTITYQLFLPDGTPTRANVKIGFTQASAAMNKDEAAAAAKKDAAAKGTVATGGTPTPRGSTVTNADGSPASTDNFGCAPQGSTVTPGKSNG